MKNAPAIYDLDDIGYVGMQVSEREKERKKSCAVFSAYIQAHKAQMNAETIAIQKLQTVTA
jgi:alpha-D-ribose 1-methylphosphonate 5-triphosphate synthase subunit PhnG